MKMHMLFENFRNYIKEESSHTDPSLKKFALDMMGSIPEDLPPLKKFLGMGGEGSAWEVYPGIIVKIWNDEDLAKEEIPRLLDSEIGVLDYGDRWAMLEKVKTFDDSWEPFVRLAYNVAKGKDEFKEPLNKIQKEIFRAAMIAVKRGYADFNSGNLGINSQGKVVQFDL